jgi:ADP-ribose pyrophosphatase
MSRVEQRRTLHTGPKFDFDEVTLVGRSGRTVTRQMIRHPGAVVVVPFLPRHPDDTDGVWGPCVVMIRNHRFTVDRELWEFPAGTMEPPEPPEVCAVRELEEEGGYRAHTVEPLGTFLTTPGMTNEAMHAYLATGLTKTRQELMEDEEISVEVVPVREALGMIDRGQLVDAKSMLALFIAHRRGKLG